jgi:hypothetical protein
VFGRVLANANRWEIADYRLYAGIIVSGLKETYPCMRNSRILAYLSGAEGIREGISEDTLAEWLSGV